MGDAEIGSETTKSVKEKFRKGQGGNPNLSAASAKAVLEKENAKLKASLNTYKFVTVVAATVAFNAYVFTYFNTWASPICLVAVEFAGIFVIARHLEIDEFIYLTIDLMRSYAKSGGKKSSDDDPE